VKKNKSETNKKRIKENKEQRKKNNNLME